MYPVSFGESGPYVDGWISRLSRYKNLEEIQDSISLDGGIAWSRHLTSILQWQTAVHHPWQLRALNHKKVNGRKLKNPFQKQTGRFIRERGSFYEKTTHENPFWCCGSLLQK